MFLFKAIFWKRLFFKLVVSFFFFFLADGKKSAIPEPEVSDNSHIELTSHPDSFGVDPVPISWGHPSPEIRGPVICTVRHASQRNAIGAHQGSYCIYTGLAVAAGKLNPDYVPDLSLTSPVMDIGPYPSWSDPKKVCIWLPCDFLLIWSNLLGKQFFPMVILGECYSLLSS